MRTVPHKSLPDGAFRRRAAGLLAALLLSVLLLPALAPAALAAGTQTAPVTVRAGFFSNGDFMHKAEDGSYAGYDVEYYYTLAGYAGWNIRFVEYGSLNDALAALRTAASTFSAASPKPRSGRAGTCPPT